MQTMTARQQSSTCLARRPRHLPAQRSYLGSATSCGGQRQGVGQVHGQREFALRSNRWGA